MEASCDSCKPGNRMHYIKRTGVFELCDSNNKQKANLTFGQAIELANFIAYIILGGSPYFISDQMKVLPNEKHIANIADRLNAERSLINE